MINYIGAVSLLALSIAASPNVTMVCSDNIHVTIGIAYTVPNVDLLKFSGGKCNATSDHVKYSQNNATNAVEIKVNMIECGMREQARVTRELRTIHYDNLAHIALGRQHGDRMFITYTSAVNLTCGVEDTYEVSINYGVIDADYTGDTGIDGGMKRYNFEMRATDAEWKNTIVPSNRAGETVYIEISSPDLDFELYKYSVPRCTFKEMDGNTVVTEYPLFDHSTNQCQNPFLDFSIKYCNATNSFKITHLVFTFDASRESNYSLTCSIKLCDFGVASSLSFCDAFENDCNIPAIAAEVNTDGGWSDWNDWTNCTAACGGGTQDRTRQCDNPSKEGKGADCQGEAFQNQTCNTDACPQAQVDVMVYEGKWGDWLDMVVCPAGSFVCGLETRMDNIDTTEEDNSAFNGVKLTCCDRVNQAVQETLMVNEGMWGNWTATKCTADHFVCSLDIQFQDFQGEGYDGNTDDHAMNGLKGECCNMNDHSSRIAVQFEAGLNTYGEYKGSQSCDVGYYACGLQARFEPYQGRGDDTSSNGLKMKCCNTNLWISAEVHTDGGWADWNEWTNCTAACGNSTRTRSRTCSDPAKEGKGADCDGAATETENCAKPVCGTWGSWVDQGCDATCGAGKQKFTRECSPSGAFCQGDAEKSDDCNVEAWGVNQTAVIVDDHHKWGDFSNWAMCEADHYICGINIRAEEPFAAENGDDTSVNGAKMECCHRDTFKKSSEIVVDEGLWGNWQQDHVRCTSPKFVCGLGAWRVKDQGTRSNPTFVNSDLEHLSLSYGDDVGVSGVHGICCDGTRSEEITFYNAHYGDKMSTQMCPERSWACGMRVRVEPDTGDGDDTALNGIEFKCCKNQC